MSILHPRAELHVRESETEFVVELPSPRRPVAVALLAVWLAVWVVGMGFVIQQFVQSDGLSADWVFLIAWAGVWLGAGAASAAYVAWQLAGTERIVLGGEELRIRREVGRFGITRAYPVAEVQELRTFGREVAPLMVAALELAGRGASGVRFRFRGRVVRFARALDEHSAHGLVESLRVRHAFPGSHGRSHEPAA